MLICFHVFPSYSCVSSKYDSSPRLTDFAAEKHRHTPMGIVGHRMMHPLAVGTDVRPFDPLHAILRTRRRRENH